MATSGPQYNNFVTKIERLKKPARASEIAHDSEIKSGTQNQPDGNVYRLTTMKGPRVAKVLEIKSLTEGT